MLCYTTASLEVKRPLDKSEAIDNTLVTRFAATIHLTFHHFGIWVTDFRGT